MSAKSFLIAHGEKLAVVAVAGGCALVLWSAASDESIRPKDNQQQIEAINAKISQGFLKNEAPVMKEPRPYLDQLLGRLSEQAPITPTMAWLTAPPDKGKGTAGGGPGDGFYYFYELLTPTVSIKDAVGALEIGVNAPETTQQGLGRRVSSEASRRWERNDKGPIINTGRHLALQVEIKIGDGEWRPLALPGGSKDGILPLASLTRDALRSIPTPEPWQLHQIRARIIAAATALDLAAPWVERPRASVLVTSGPASEGPTKDEALLGQAAREVKAKDGALFKSLLRPVEGPLPPGTKLEANERLFLGPWSPVAAVEATASVRFALVGLSTGMDPNDPTKSRDVGRFLLLRLFAKGAERKWMEKPIEEKFGQGDVLGIKDHTMVDPFGAAKIRVDLPTPFVVEKLVKDQKRIIYWSLKPKARPAGGKDRDLVLDKKEVATDIVVLKNPDSGSELVLTKLISISPPANADTLIYPHRTATYSEKDEFAKAPSDFRQWGLQPEAPKAYEAGTGPLADLYRARKDEGALDAENYATDTTYYVMPDARVVWWDTVEHKVKIEDPRGVMTAKSEAPAAPPAGDPAGEAAPAPQQPGPAPKPAAP
ncbi:MAG TPA: hypothetical protein DCS97_05825, partial [Planctomycetes bacterium]|nr:hypothetical protein [Planctomycetota bacterium]